MAETFLATSKNEKQVYYDDAKSHSATHFADAPALRDLVIEVIKNMKLDKPRMLFDTDMGKVVGNTDLVTNKPGDIIVYAKRKNRDDVYTSFNKSQSPQPCSIIAIGVESKRHGTYELLSAWIGSVDSPPFPGDEYATDESKQFWNSHSLVWGTQEIQEGTETTVCPW